MRSPDILFDGSDSHSGEGDDADADLLWPDPNISVDMMEALKVECNPVA
jgi:hypothetical protein